MQTEERLDKYVGAAVVLVITAVYMVEECFGARYTSSPALNVFCHVNLLHLILCSWGFLVSLKGTPWPSWVMLVWAWLFASLAAYLSPQPFQGTSGVVFAVTGMVLAKYPTRDNICAVGIAATGCTMIQPASWCVHLVPLALGFALSLTVKHYEKCHLPKNK